MAFFFGGGAPLHTNHCIGSAGARSSREARGGEGREKKRRWGGEEKGEVIEGTKPPAPTSPASAPHIGVQTHTRTHTAQAALNTIAGQTKGAAIICSGEN